LKRRANPQQIAFEIDVGVTDTVRKVAPGSRLAVLSKKKGALEAKRCHTMRGRMAVSTGE
jgi:hypothetical protein